MYVLETSVIDIKCWHNWFKMEQHSESNERGIFWARLTIHVATNENVLYNLCMQK